MGKIEEGKKEGNKNNNKETNQINSLGKGIQLTRKLIMKKERQLGK